MSDKPRIACLLPGETFSSAWVCAWTDLQTHLGQYYRAEVMFGYTSIVNITRSSMVKALLESKEQYDYVLWIDDDNLLAPKQLDSMLQDLEVNPRLSGVVGWCFCQSNGLQNPPLISCGKLDGLKAIPFSFESITKARVALEPIDYSGFPAALHRFSVYEDVGYKAFNPILTDDNQWGFAGEDVAFYHHARLSGHRFAVDLRVKVPHLKLRDSNFTIESLEQFSKAVSSELAA